MYIHIRRSVIISRQTDGMIGWWWRGLYRWRRCCWRGVAGPLRPGPKAEEKSAREEADDWTAHLSWRRAARVGPRSQPSESKTPKEGTKERMPALTNFVVLCVLFCLLRSRSRRRGLDLGDRERLVVGTRESKAPARSVTPSVRAD